MKSIVFASVLVLTSAASAAVELSAGFSRVDITPPLGCYVSGYYKDRYAKSVLDPLQINCVAFSDGETKAVIMQIDTVAVSDHVYNLMRDAVAKATGVKRDAIFLHASHTHDGGPLRSSAEQIANGTEPPLTRMYRELCTSRAADAAVEALADLKPASLSMARSVAKRITFGRRYRMKNGKVYTNPGVKNPDIVGPDGEPPDESVQVLRIDRKDALPICVINFQTHPDVVGGETITADWPGLTRTVFEAATMGKTLSIVLNGTQGDVNHVNVMPRPGEENGLVNDFDNVPRGYSHAWHMANVLAGAALSVWLKCEPLEAGKIRFGTADVRVASQRAKTKEELELARKYWTLHQEGKDDQIPFKHMELTTELARSKRILRLENGPDFFDLPICALAIGDSVAFAGFPGEPFNDIGKAVKKDSPFKLTVPMCLANASRGYFPCSDSYVGGGYESASSAFAPEVADKLIAGQLGLLKSLKGGCQAAALFNGKDLSGWTAVADKNATGGYSASEPTWEVVGGAIRTTGTPFGYLRTERNDFADFSLKLEYRWWRPTPRPNSGVFVRLAAETGTFIPKCYENQLDPKSACSIFALGGSVLEGVAPRDPYDPENALSGIAKVPAKAASAEKPFGEWNVLEIDARGDEIVSRLNGVEMNRVKGVKTPKGAIALQSEGGAVEFRNISCEQGACKSK